MDQNTPQEAFAKPQQSTRVALGVLALCFVLAVIGRGLGESFTVFLKPISESFGWDRAEVVSVYSLSALAGGLAAPLVGRLFDRSGPRTVYTLGLLRSMLGFGILQALSNLLYCLLATAGKSYLIMCVAVVIERTDRACVITAITLGD